MYFDYHIIFFPIELVFKDNIQTTINLLKKDGWFDGHQLSVKKILTHLMKWKKGF